MSAALATVKRTFIGGLLIWALVVQEVITEIKKRRRA